jgi:cytochrome c-type biogenesis protein CcmH/NrfG
MGVAVDPRHSTAHVYRARAHHALGDHAAAIADFERALVLLPTLHAEVAEIKKTLAAARAAAATR